MEKNIIGNNMTFDASYYDFRYFADPHGKTYRTLDGKKQRWGYQNPKAEWLGCKPIVKAWKAIFGLEKGKSKALDVGCGRGTFVCYARDIGIEAVGFDFSKFAVKNLYPRCNKKWIIQHDATKPWPYPDKYFDLVTVLDLMEHIYMEDIDKVINNMYRVAKQWIFLQIATIGGGSGNGIHEKGYILKRGDNIPVELEGVTVAGHVTIQDREFWINKLYDYMDDNKFRFRDDLVLEFIKRIDPLVIANWIKNTLLIMERV